MERDTLVNMVQVTENKFVGKQVKIGTKQD